MSRSVPNSPRHGKPGPDELAGIPMSFEDNGRIFRRRKVRAKKRSRHAPIPDTGRPPTADDLAGIPVCIEEKEDLTVRPRARKRRGS